MAMGKSFRIFERDNGSTPYSVLVEQRSKDTSLMFENNVVAVLTAQEKESIKRQYTKVLDAYGCLGVLPVHVEGRTILYLVLVTGCISLGKVADSEIFKITQTGFISLQKQPNDDEHVSEVRKIFNSGTFYFSWSSTGEAIDITLCAQRRAKTTITDNRFFWNKAMFVHLAKFGVKTSDWTVKAMCGCVEMRTVYVGHRQGKAVIISRLSSERVGTRFHVRGANDAGHVANFVETEQAIYMEDSVCSYIQVRGSVPLFWEQTGVQVGQHKVRMSRGPEAASAALDRHFTQLKQRYGHQTVVNLLGASHVGSKESEGLLSTLFQQTQTKMGHSDVPHIAFDYHQECRGGNTQNLSKLKAALMPFLTSYSVFFTKCKTILSEQVGTIRTNCLDCLDRTNCVQTFIGLTVLLKQLEFLDLVEKQQSISRFEEVFKQMWVDNGNEVSRMYAGTGAIQGGSKLMDGARSAARTIQNNLLDSGKQEAIEVVLMGGTLSCMVSDRARVLLDPNHIQLNKNILRRVCDRCEEYLEPIPIRLGIGTYNVNGGKHFRSVVYKDLSLSDWLLDNYVQDGKELDLFAIGFEEIVDLNASNIMSASGEQAKMWGEELQRVLSRDREYVLVTSIQLVGVCLFLFARPELTPYIRDVATDSVKTGLGGATGNKGGVAIRCVLYNTALCFLCAHFAAGQSQVTDRNNDYMEITKKLVFPTGTNLRSHDYIFWCGDFNYRVDMDKETLRESLKDCKDDFQEILKHDQLMVQKELRNVFINYEEGNINFAPTYKYDLFSDDYDTSEKARAPAWTDRVLWKRRKFLEGESKLGWNRGKLIHYGRAELKQSDHRPVVAIIDVDVYQSDEERRQEIFWEMVKEEGPPDCTVLVECVGRSSMLLEESTKLQLLEHLSQFGEVVVVRHIDETIIIMFKEGRSCLEALKENPVTVDGVTFKLRLKTENWRSLILSQLDLCKNNTVPLCEYKVPDSLDTRDCSSPVRPNRPPQPKLSPIMPKRPENSPARKEVQPQEEVKNGVNVAKQRPVPPPPESRQTPPPPCPERQTPPPCPERQTPPPPCPEVRPTPDGAPPVPKRPDSGPGTPKRSSSCDSEASTPPSLPPPLAPPPPIPPRSSAPPPIPNRNK